jgi:hypothetical protein
MLPRNILLPPPSAVVFVLSSGRIIVIVIHYLTQVVPGLNIHIIRVKNKKVIKCTVNNYSNLVHLILSIGDTSKVVF